VDKNKLLGEINLGIYSPWGIDINMLMPNQYNSTSAKTHSRILAQIKALRYITAYEEIHSENKKAN
jgi:hypothetical protein